jgi:hypothetical protein
MFIPCNSISALQANFPPNTLKKIASCCAAATHPVYGLPAAIIIIRTTRLCS